jgi:hypothetical protein
VGEEFGEEEEEGGKRERLAGEEMAWAEGGRGGGKMGEGDVEWRECCERWKGEVGREVALAEYNRLLAGELLRNRISDLFKAIVSNFGGRGGVMGEWKKYLSSSVALKYALFSRRRSSICCNTFRFATRLQVRSSVSKVSLGGREE